MKKRFGIRRGLTLVELAMVMLIIAMSAAIIVPKLADFVGSWDVKTEAQKLRSVLRQARELAIAEGTMYRIVFDPDNESYAVQYYVATLFEEAISMEPYGKMPEGIDLASTDFMLDRLIFNEFGTPSASGYIYIKEFGLNPQSALIQVDTTGRIVAR